MLQAANTDLFKSLAIKGFKAHSSECQNLLFLYKWSQSQLKLVCGFYFLHPRHYCVKYWRNAHPFELLYSAHHVSL